jgi:hypothetical protein
MTRVLKGQSDASMTIFRLQALIRVVILISAACSFGTGKTNTSPTVPSQPGYPSTPAVPITWSPSSSPLPAPPAQVPPPPGSNDFPLSVSSPTDGATVTSPVTVAASATPPGRRRRA